MSDQQDSDTSEVSANDAIASGYRLGLAQAMGHSGFGTPGDDDYRNYFEVYGWPRGDLDGWNEDNWLALYLRNGYAKVVNDLPVFTTWRDNPLIEGESGLESQVEKLEDNHRIWSYAQRVDRVAGIGHHGLLVLGFEDVDPEDTDGWEADAREANLNGLDDLNSLKPVLEAQIEEITWGDPGSERWGKPEYYTLDLSDDTNSETEDDPLSTLKVHWTRVIDVPASRLLEDETLARPRAEPVLNNLLDIEKTLGAAAEAAYRGADYGLHLNADPTEVDLDYSNLRDELQRYEAELQRYIRTEGVDINRLGGEIADPTGIIESNLDEISAVTGIPKKELRGNESGELSGAEADTESFYRAMGERRVQYNTPYIVRGILDRFRLVGILPQVPYTVSWPDLSELNESDRAEIESKRAQVISAVPGLSGELALRYLKEGADAIELDDQTANGVLGELDESDSGVRSQFERDFDLGDVSADD